MTGAPYTKAQSTASPITITWNISDKMAEEYLEPISEKSPNRPLVGYEYLDHTADVQLHAWGPTLKESFEQCAKAMFGYITELG